MGLFDRIAKAFNPGQEQAAPAVKPGRNEACWCGSGKKYKKCHEPEDGRKQASAACSLKCGPT